MVKIDPVMTNIFSIGILTSLRLCWLSKIVVKFNLNSLFPYINLINHMIITLSWFNSLIFLRIVLVYKGNIEIFSSRIKNNPKVLNSLYFYLTKYNFKCKNQKLILKLIFLEYLQTVEKKFSGSAVKMKENRK